ncbi:MAG: hypothetical protein PHT29_08405, partial [Eubacteriales bacterium]|nr:hypothetical protein [Eubacteriales bacterium]MDD3290893.1 hypothetical protein [Eubacteriales bacterium]
MKRRLSGILLALCMVLAILPATAFAAGATRTVDCETFVVEISNVYAIDSASKSATEGYVTT